MDHRCKTGQETGEPYPKAGLWGGESVKILGYFGGQIKELNGGLNTGGINRDFQHSGHMTRWTVRNSQRHDGAWVIL